ncbi:MAG: hypothetical protein RL660_2662 [Bacteroidota bacterium]
MTIENSGSDLVEIDSANRFVYEHWGDGTCFGHSKVYGTVEIMRDTLVFTHQFSRQEKTYEIFEEMISSDTIYFVVVTTAGDPKPNTTFEYTFGDYMENPVKVTTDQSGIASIHKRGMFSRKQLRLLSRQTKKEMHRIRLRFTFTSQKHRHHHETELYSRLFNKFKIVINENPQDIDCIVRTYYQKCGDSLNYLFTSGPHRYCYPYEWTDLYPLK